MMTRLSGIAMLVVMFVAVGQPAAAQLVLPWFNGVGASAGGGPARFTGAGRDPLAQVIRPKDDTAGAGAIGLLLSLGGERWALMLPEYHYFPTAIGTEDVAGTLTLDSQTVAFTTNLRSMSAHAVLVGGQASVLRSGRLWLRGGIGGGWVSRALEAEDQRISLSVGSTSSSGLALSGATGVTIWQRMRNESAMRLEVELHYVRIRTDGLRVAVPSIRVGWRAWFMRPERKEPRASVDRRVPDGASVMLRDLGSRQRHARGGIASNVRSMFSSTASVEATPASR